MSIYNLYRIDTLKFKGLNVIIIVIVSLFFLRNSVHAQDIHFSQLLSTPVLTNPANSGMADGQVRIASDYRNQWASIGTPFNTFYTSFDKKLTISNQLFGIGLTVIHDQSSGTRLTAEGVYFSLAYTRFYKNHQFVIGIQPGFVYRNIDANGITFGSQFDLPNERFNSSLPNYENNLIGNMHYFDMNIGILWKANIENLLPVAGFTLSHINRPVESFMGDSSSNILPLKYTVHGQITIPISIKYDLTPCFLFGYTPGARELVVGGIGGYMPVNFLIPVKKIYVLNLYRINPARNIDAIIIGGGVKFSTIDVGISYDINVSSLSNATNFRGAFEISIIYIGGTQKLKSVVEPCFIY